MVEIGDQVAAGRLLDQLQPGLRGRVELDRRTEAVLRAPVPGREVFLGLFSMSSKETRAASRRSTSAPDSRALQTGRATARASPGHPPRSPLESSDGQTADRAFVAVHRLLAIMLEGLLAAIRRRQPGAGAVEDGADGVVVNIVPRLDPARLA